MPINYDTEYPKLQRRCTELQVKVERLTAALEHIKQYEDVRTRGRPFSSAVFNIADNCLKDQEGK